MYNVVSDRVVPFMRLWTWNRTLRTALGLPTDTMFIESYLYLREFEPNRPKPEFGSLSGIKVTGDVAIAETTVKTSPANIKAGKTNDQAQAAEETTVYFLRVNGKWLYATEAEWAGIVPREQSR